MSHIIRESLSLALVDLVGGIESAQILLSKEVLNQKDVHLLLRERDQLQKVVEHVQSRVDRWQDFLSQLPDEKQLAELELWHNFKTLSSRLRGKDEDEVDYTVVELIAKGSRMVTMLNAAIREAELESSSQHSLTDSNADLKTAIPPTETPLNQFETPFRGETGQPSGGTYTIYRPFANPVTSPIPITTSVQASRPAPVSVTMTTFSNVHPGMNAANPGSKMHFPTFSTPASVNPGTGFTPSMPFYGGNPVPATQPNGHPLPSAPNNYQQNGYPPPSASNHYPYSSFRPIKLEPLRFRGDPKSWPTFWLSFERTIHNLAIPAYEKHLHLLQCLERDSPAEKAISAYQPSDTNYPVVLDILKRKFGNPEVLREKLRAELYHRPVAKNTLASLRSLSEDIERICLQLGQLGTQGESEFIRTIIRSKLPQEVLLELKHLERSSGHSWGEVELRNGLSDLVSMREEVKDAVKTLRPEEEKKNSDQPRPKKADPILRSYSGAEANDSNETSGGDNEQQPKPNQSRRNNRYQKKCSLCGEIGHIPSRCPKYPTPQARREQITKQKRCFRCLSSEHLLSNCPRKMTCGNCQSENHHFLICNQPLKTKSKDKDEPVETTRSHMILEAKPEEQNDEVKSIPETPAEPQTKEEPKLPEEAVGSYVAQVQRSSGYLMTRTVLVSSARDPCKQFPVLLFFDPGSQTSYIAKSLVRKLLPERTGSDQLRVEVFGGEQRGYKTHIYRVRIRRLDGSWESVDLNEVEKIGSPMKTAQWIGDGAAPEREDVRQALQSIPGIPEILIGTRQFWDYFVSRTKVASGFYVIQTIIGPVLGGESTFHIPESQRTYSSLAIHESNVEQMPSAKAIEDFWSLETIGIREDPGQDDDQVAYQLFKKSVRRLEDGRYSVRWPWRNPHPDLPSNFRLAYSRLSSLLNRLRASPEDLKRYHEDIQDKINRGIVEMAECKPYTKEHFLPHHAVITPKKLRVVYAANACVRGRPSLNDCLYRGPVDLPDLAGMCLRFRNCRVPMLADVEKAFLMIALEPEDREVCKFLWLRNPIEPLTTENLAILRFTRVAFGVISAPFMLAGVVRHHLEAWGTSLAKRMSNNIYVDNVLLECETAGQAIEEAKEAKRIFADAMMNLREFVSCSSIANEQKNTKRLLEIRPPGTWNIVTKECVNPSIESPSIHVRFSRHTDWSTITSGLIWSTWVSVTSWFYWKALASTSIGNATSAV